MPNQAATSTYRWLDYLVWTVALWASFLNLLNFNHYPLFRAEVGLTLLALGLLGTLMGMVQHVARPRLSFLFTALFAALMVDLNTSIELSWFYALLVAFAVVGFFAQDALLKVTLAAFTAVLLFQFLALATGIGDPVRDENKAQNLQTENRAGATRPAIVHLVLDSYLGLEGMALGPDEYRKLRAEHVAFFTERGFQLYPRAYSRHASTMRSLPYLFSYGSIPTAVHVASARYAVPEQLPYFSDIDSRGYRISAVLPAYVDLCVKQKLTSCRNFESSALRSMLGTEMGVFDRSKVFGFTLLQLTSLPSEVALEIQSRANDLFGINGRLPFNRSELYPLASIEQMDRFTRELADLRPGEARFAHLLLPHDPYILKADCSAKPETAWLDEHGPGSEAARELAYADQVRCLQRRIARMLDMLDRTKAGREAIVLIHGDHGSRIAPAQPSASGQELSQRQMLMTYSTFFAIRIPGAEGGEVPGTHSLDELMADFRTRDFASAPRPKDAPAEVLVKGESRNSRERQPPLSFEP